MSNFVTKEEMALMAEIKRDPQACWLLRRLCRQERLTRYGALHAFGDPRKWDSYRDPKKAERLAKKLGLKGSAAGVICGRYEKISTLNGSTPPTVYYEPPITTLRELRKLCAYDQMLNRPRCGHRVLEQIRSALVSYDAAAKQRKAAQNRKNGE